MGNNQLIEDVKARIEKCTNFDCISCDDRRALLAYVAELEGAVDAFIVEVERRAEEKMLKTGKLEGAHYAAMKQVQAERKAAALTGGEKGGG